MEPYFKVHLGIFTKSFVCWSFIDRRWFDGHQMTNEINIFCVFLETSKKMAKIL